MAVVVLGGGISGLTAARTLQQQGREFLLLERCPTLGGLTRTVEVGEFCFDYTGHFLHLSRYPTPEDIPYANLKNDDWVRVNRRSCCYVGGKLITAPIQYHLSELPQNLLQQCAGSYEARPPLTGNGDATFRDYIVSGFGQALADLFLIPQNEKTMAISLDRLSQRAVRRFFPRPDDRLVRAGMLGHTPAEANGYNSAFWYPKVGGIGRLVKGLQSGTENLALAQDVVSLNLRDKTLRTRDGSMFAWDMIFSSIPLKCLCAMTDDRDLVSASQQLSHSSTISFNIGIRGQLPAEFNNLHWIYVPDRNIPFYRVGFFSNIGKGMSTAGHNAIYAEVGMPSEAVDRTDLVHDLQPRVIRALEELGWVESRNIVCVVVHVLSHAYIHHTPQRDSVFESVTARLRDHCIYPIGRYGLWDYTSMEDSMESARSAVLEHI
jgi:protoporphyrinogen oxidase